MTYDHTVSTHGQTQIPDEARAFVGGQEVPCTGDLQVYEPGQTARVVVWAQDEDGAFILIPGSMAGWVSVAGNTVEVARRLSITDLSSIDMAYMGALEMASRAVRAEDPPLAGIVGTTAPGAAAMAALQRLICASI